MSYEEEGNVASRQFSRENILKAFVVLEAQKDISKKTCFDLFGLSPCFMHTTVHEEMFSPRNNNASGGKIIQSLYLSNSTKYLTVEILCYNVLH